jgi:hypothetical protein
LISIAGSDGQAVNDSEKTSCSNPGKTKQDMLQLDEEAPQQNMQSWPLKFRGKE